MRSPQTTPATAEPLSLVHQQLLQLHGIHVPNLPVEVARNGQRMYREVRLRIPGSADGLEPVTLKVPAAPDGSTPYSLGREEVLVGGEPLRLLGSPVVQVPIPPEESDWHLKGYTLPFRGTRNPFQELRINPRITGYCPGRCSFCHRTHSHQLKPDRRMVSEPGGIIDRVVADEGDAALSRLGRVMFISELFGREDRFLDAVEVTRDSMWARGYPSDREFNCCAQDVRTPDGHRRLRSLVRPDRYSYTLEVFMRREQIMGRYKGLPLAEVYRILDGARGAGFAEIQLNYLAGLDGLRDCLREFEALRERGLVDSVGLSTFTAWSAKQRELRHPEAWDWPYYEQLATGLHALGIQTYHPESYDMRCPYHVRMHRSPL